MLHKVTFKLTVFTLKVQFVRMTSGQIGTVVQIQNIGDCETSVAYIVVSPRFDVHTGCQFEDTQQEQAELKPEETYTHCKLSKITPTKTKTDIPTRNAHFKAK